MWERDKKIGRFALMIGLGLVLPPSAVTDAAPGVGPGVGPGIAIDIEPTRGTLDERFRLSVRITLAGEARIERYEPPGLDDFRVVDQTSDRTVNVTGNGQTVTRISHHYTLAPRREGLLRVDGASVRVDGRVHRASARVIEVRNELDAAPDGSDESGGDGDTARAPGPAPGGRHALVPPELPADRPPPEIFVHASADRETAYVGQQVTVTWVLYTRHELIEFEPQVPRTDDFWTEILYEPSTFVRQGEIFLSGHRYQVVVVSRRALFPLRAGRLEIEPYRARASALYTPLGTQAVVDSQALEIQAMPLPEGAPADFDATYVGLFKVSAALDREALELGDSLVLTLNVRGHGAIRRTTPPRVEVPGFEVERSPDFDESVQSTDKTAIGVRQYRYWLTPTRAGALTIPAIAIPYLDPRDGHYKRAQSQPLQVRVRAGAAALDADGRATALERDPASGGIRWWIPGALFTLALVLVVLAVRGQRRHRPDRSGRSGRSGRAHATTQRTRLRQAEAHMRDGRFVDFFTELALVVETAVQARLGVAIKQLPRERALAMLGARGVESGLVARVREQLEECDVARFAGSDGDEDDMRHALERVRGLVEELASNEG